MKIPCTIGMLTYDSEARLARALESVKDFADIVIADGGSTDKTLEIARAYGARVIEQSKPGHPIEDFAQERERTLLAARGPWFFYLDSDEIMSPELARAIRGVTEAPTARDAYRVRYLKTNADGTKRYRTFKEYYQVRLVRTGIGARFERPVHERIVVPAGVQVGQLEAPWLVPLEEDDLSFRAFSQKAWTRTAASVAAWRPRGLTDPLYRVVAEPVVSIGKSLAKMVAVKLRFGKEAIPARYEALRMLYACYLAAQYARRCVGERAPHSAAP